MSSGFDRLERELVAAAARLEHHRTLRPASGRLAGRLGLSLSVVVTLAIAAGAVVLLRPADRVARPGDGSAFALGPLVGYRDLTGWSFYYPAAFHLDQRRFESTRSGPYVEVTVASFPMRGALIVSSNGMSAGLNAPLDPAGRFPANGVAFRLQEIPSAGSQRPAHGPAPPISLSAFSHAPVSVERDETSVQSYLNGRPAGDARPLILRVALGHGTVWTALAWIGPLAPPSLRLALERAIASLTTGDAAANRARAHG